MNYIIRFCRSALFIACAAYVAAMAYMIYAQRDFMYHPSGHYATPVEAGAPNSFEEMLIKTEDGVELKGWYSPPTKKAATIVFFHGNADYLTNLVSVAQRYTDAGYGFLLAEYRGYSDMPGKPTENNLYADARAYLHTLFDRGTETDKIIVMGHSLGAAIAMQMAVEFRPAGLVMLSPFSSMTDMADMHYPYFPVSFMVLDHFDNFEKISSINVPLVIVHGSNDHVVPEAHAHKLYNAAKDPKSIHILEGRDHSEVFDPAYDVVELFADTLVGR